MNLKQINVNIYASAIYSDKGKISFRNEIVDNQSFLFVSFFLFLFFFFFSFFLFGGRGFRWYICSV